MVIIDKRLRRSVPENSIRTSVPPPRRRCKNSTAVADRDPTSGMTTEQMHAQFEAILVENKAWQARCAAAEAAVRKSQNLKVTEAKKAEDAKAKKRFAEQQKQQAMKKQKQAENAAAATTASASRMVLEITAGAEAAKQAAVAAAEVATRQAREATRQAQVAKRKVTAERRRSQTEREILEAQTLEAVSQLTAKIESLELVLQQQRKNAEKQKKAAATRASKKKNAARDQKRLRSRIEKLKQQLVRARNLSAGDKRSLNEVVITDRVGPGPRSPLTLTGMTSYLHFCNASKVADTRLRPAIGSMDSFLKDDLKMGLKAPSPSTSGISRIPTSSPILTLRRT